MNEENIVVRANFEVVIVRSLVEHGPHENK